MSRLALLFLIAPLATPAIAAQPSTSALSPTDLARVERQCSVLRFRQAGSLAANPPEEPAAGVIVTDPASYWAEHANGMDSTLSKVNLDALTIEDCRRGGFVR